VRRGRRAAEAVVVRVDEAAHEAVAVVVEPGHGRLGRAREEGSVRVVAVAVAPGEAIPGLAGVHDHARPPAVAVAVDVQGLDASDERIGHLLAEVEPLVELVVVVVVDQRVAVVVAAVADLLRVRVHPRVAVHAVQVVVDEAGRALAGVGQAGGAAEAVVVVVGVPGRRVNGLLVDDVVAVVVDAVAELGCVGADRGVGVVAVAVALGDPVPVVVDRERIGVDAVVGLVVDGALAATTDQQDEQQETTSHTGLHRAFGPAERDSA
jgi:hypothetical protein